MIAFRQLMRTLLFFVLLAAVSGAQFAFSQAETDLDINSPAIISLKKSMATRFVQLRPHLDAGVIGLTREGAIALRDTAMVDVKTLPALDALIMEENKDRATLYREIARANNRPEWESDLRATFGKRWINRLPVGWFYRDEKGQWIKKAEL